MGIGFLPLLSKTSSSRTKQTTGSKESQIVTMFFLDHSIIRLNDHPSHQEIAFYLVADGGGLGGDG